MVRPLIGATAASMITMVAVLSGCGSSNSATVPAQPGPAHPQPLVLRPGAAIKPVRITNVGPLPDAGLLAHPNAPAFIAGKGFSPDVQRAIDLTMLRLSLERYRKAHGQYPSTLAKLFPAFAPIAYGRALTVPPRDPITNRPYSYRDLRSGRDYRLGATLTGNRSYVLSAHSP